MKVPQGVYKFIKEPSNVILLTCGGSERNFYRVSFSGNKTLVYMHYTDEKEENEYYSDISALMKETGINVPEIYYKEKGDIFLEDLGDIHLYNLVKNNTEDNTISYYRNVLDQLKKIHLLGYAFYKKTPFRISGEFNYLLYRWESKYFLDNLVRNYFKFSVDENGLESDFHFLAEMLSKKDMVLVHRDCQSKNIMIRNNIPYFIDFQGLRLGLPQYDLASLLEDPYVDLSSDTKEKLLNYYMDGDGLSKTFFSMYKYCAIQRLMQALGAYAFLGLKKGKKEFLNYIPSGLNKLNLILDDNKDLAGLKKLLSNIRQP